MMPEPTEQLPLNTPADADASVSKPVADLGFWLSWVISVLFHPLLMPTYILVAGSIGVKGFLYYSGDNWVQFLQVFAGLTVGLPGLAIMILRQFKLISGITLDEQTDRPLPMFITALFYFFAAYLLQAHFMFNPDMLFMLLSVAVTIVLAALTSLVWKISAHAIGTAGALTLILLLARQYPENNLMWFVVGMSAAWGITAAARLKLQAHTPAQVWIGSGLGMLCTGSIYMLLSAL